MNVLNTKSLAATVENLNEVFFNNIVIPKPEKTKIAKWIASRQGGPRAYADMFAPMPADFTRGFNLFTGEKVETGAGVSYCLGQDCCRLLLKLNIKDNIVQTALANAQKGISQRINSPEYTKGMYCCGRCSTVYWHYLAADIDKNEDVLNAGMKLLKSYRIGDGKWRRFPYWHTVFVLTQMPSEISGGELKYTLPVCERILSSKPRSEKYSSRRFKIAQKALILL